MRAVLLSVLRIHLGAILRAILLSVLRIHLGTVLRAVRGAVGSRLRLLGFFFPLLPQGQRLLLRRKSLVRPVQPEAGKEDQKRELEAQEQVTQSDRQCTEDFNLRETDPCRTEFPAKHICHHFRISVDHGQCLKCAETQIGQNHQKSRNEADHQRFVGIAVPSLYLAGLDDGKQPDHQKENPCCNKHQLHDQSDRTKSTCCSLSGCCLE